MQGTVFGVLGRPFVKSQEQGAATTVYAALAPELEGKSGVYLSDCAIKTPSKLAQDPELAAKLWTVSCMVDCSYLWSPNRVQVSYSAGRTAQTVSCSFRSWEPQAFQCRLLARCVCHGKPCLSMHRVLFRGA
jgi:hypothetical protein